jgi:hypothetical protein
LYNFLKVHLHSNKNSSPDCNSFIHPSNLLIFRLTMELLNFLPDLEQLRDRTIKQALCLIFFVQPLFQSFISFQNKTQRFIAWHTQVSHICGIFWISLRQQMLCLHSCTKAYVDFIRMTFLWENILANIYCKVKQWIQRELSDTIKSRCASVWNEVDIYGG